MWNELIAQRKKQNVDKKRLSAERERLDRELQVIPQEVEAAITARETADPLLMSYEEFRDVEGKESYFHKKEERLKELLEQNAEETRAVNADLARNRVALLTLKLAGMETELQKSCRGKILEFVATARLAGKFISLDITFGLNTAATSAEIASTALQLQKNFDSEIGG